MTRNSSRPVGVEEIHIRVSVGLQVVDGGLAEEPRLLRAGLVGERALGQVPGQLLGRLDGPGHLADHRDVGPPLADEVVELGGLRRRDREQLAPERALQRAHREVVVHEREHDCKGSARSPGTRAAAGSRCSGDPGRASSSSWSVNLSLIGSRSSGAGQRGGRRGGASRRQAPGQPASWAGGSVSVWGLNSLVPQVV